MYLSPNGEVHLLELRDVFGIGVERTSDVGILNLVVLLQAQVSLFQQFQLTGNGLAGLGELLVFLANEEIAPEHRQQDGNDQTRGGEQPVALTADGVVAVLLDDGQDVVDFDLAQPAVVEVDIVRELDGEVQHVRIAVPDGLGDVDVAGDHEVVREDGRPVHQDAVFPALAAFEREEMLMLLQMIKSKKKHQQNLKVI